MKNFFFCFLCGVIVYEAYLGDRHIHAPEQAYPTNPPISSPYLVSSGSVSTHVITKPLIYVVQK